MAVLILLLIMVATLAQSYRSHRAEALALSAHWQAPLPLPRLLAALKRWRVLHGLRRACRPPT